MPGKWRRADQDEKEDGYWTWRPDERGVMRRVRVPGEAQLREDRAWRIERGLPPDRESGE